MPPMMIWQAKTLVTAAAAPSAASGFYAALLANRKFWDAALGSEGMMALSLPSAGKTNGTYLVAQANHSFVRAMVTRERTWHPRFGALPAPASNRGPRLHVAAAAVLEPRAQDSCRRKV